MRLLFHTSKGAFSRLLTFLSGALIFATVLSAAPTSITPAGDLKTAGRKLFARACPTVAEIVPQLQAKGLGANTIFYTKPATNQQALAFAATLDPPGQCYASLVEFNQQMDWIDQCQQNGSEQDKLVPRISAAIATGATGTAYILITKGADIQAPGTIWGTAEYPTLQRNGNIAKVVRVAYDNFKDQETVWSAGDATTGPAPSVP